MINLCRYWFFWIIVLPLQSGATDMTGGKPFDKNLEARLNVVISPLVTDADIKVRSIVQVPQGTHLVDALPSTLTHRGTSDSITRDQAEAVPIQIEVIAVAAFQGHDAHLLELLHKIEQAVPIDYSRGDQVRVYRKKPSLVLKRVLPTTSTVVINTVEEKPSIPVVQHQQINHSEQPLLTRVSDSSLPQSWRNQIWQYVLLICLLLGVLWWLSPQKKLRSLIFGTPKIAKLKCKESNQKKKLKPSPSLTGVSSAPSKPIQGQETSSDKAAVKQNLTEQTVLEKKEKSQDQIDQEKVTTLIFKLEELNSQQAEEYLAAIQKSDSRLHTAIMKRYFRWSFIDRVPQKVLQNVINETINEVLLKAKYALSKHAWSKILTACSEEKRRYIEQTQDERIVPSSAEIQAARMVIERRIRAGLIQAKWEMLTDETDIERNVQDSSVSSSSVGHSVSIPVEADSEAILDALNNDFYDFSHLNSAEKKQLKR